MAQEQNVPVQELSEILQIRRDKLAELQQNGADPFQITRFNRTHTSKDICEGYREEARTIEVRGEEKQIVAKISPLDGQIVTVAGRIMSKRGMGKVGFAHIQDIDGKVQLFVKKDILGEDAYNVFKKYDIGDIVGAEGEVFTTQTGEISIRVNSITLLSKSLQPLPEKFHGMTNTDLRYRQRYVDLIMSEGVKDTKSDRSHVVL